MGQHERGQQDRAALAVTLGSLSCRQVLRSASLACSAPALRARPRPPTPHAGSQQASGQRACMGVVSSPHGRSPVRHSCRPQRNRSGSATASPPGLMQHSRASSVQAGRLPLRAGWRARAVRPGAPTAASQTHTCAAHAPGVRQARAGCLSPGGLRGIRQCGPTGCAARGAHVHLLCLGRQNPTLTLPRPYI